MNLGELITTLEALPPDMVAKHGLGPPQSYRGYYEDIAFPPEEEVTVAAMLARARAALETTFTGYKGGEYRMNTETRCWLARWGDCSGQTIAPTVIGIAVQAECEACAQVVLAADKYPMESEGQIHVSDAVEAIRARRP